MERKGHKKEQPPKEYWQQKGWRKKLYQDFTVYNGHFVVGEGNSKRSFIGSIYEKSLAGKNMVHVFIQSHRPKIFQDLPITLIDKKKFTYIYEINYDNQPVSANDAILQTEDILKKMLD